MYSGIAGAQQFFCIVSSTHSFSALGRIEFVQLSEMYAEELVQLSGICRVCSALWSVRK